MKRKLIGTISIVSALVMTFASFASAIGLGAKLVEINTAIKGVGTVIIAFSAIATGVMYMGSSVNPELKGKAKAALIGVIIGTVLVLLSSEIGNMVQSVVGGTW